MAVELQSAPLPAVSRPRLARRGRLGRKPWGAIALFIGPAMLYYVVFILYPILATFYYSVHTIFPSGGQVVLKFVGLNNFVYLFSDEIFFTAVQNTLTWGFVGPLIEMVTSTSLALLVYFKVPLYRFYRVAWFTPVLVSGVIIGLVFRWIFNYDWGLVNVALRAIGLEQFALNWLGRVDTPIWVVIFVHYWATFGNSFVLLLAGLSAIPVELLEAAYIDGATRLQTIRRVMLPLLRPTFVTVLILSFLGKMNAFSVVWALTNGGPMHMSETVATYMQKRAFGWSSLDLGYPAAIGVVWFGVIVVGVGVLSRWLRRQVDV
jgi:raffinose/stachyose/melibiose transport system permease protein